MSDEEGRETPEMIAQLDRAFTAADRKRVEEVLVDVLDEMSDSHTLRNMFGPYADVVVKVLTDDRITQNRADIEEFLKEDGPPKRGRHARQVAREFVDPLGYEDDGVSKDYDEDFERRQNG